MKKILFVLVALLFASPAWAAVDISATPSGCDVVISFDASGEPNLVRAFALDLSVDNDANIVSVTLLSTDYVIHPGTIVIDTSGNVTDMGSPVAPQSDLPSDTLAGIGTGGVTIEMASLYAPVGPSSPNAPAPSGDLVSITVDKNCTLTVSANVSRAGSSGVVMESPDEVVTVNLPGPTDVTTCALLCYAGMADEEQWNAVGQPTCWCYPRQCLGDADGLPYGKFNYYVSIPDLDILKDAWNKPVTDPSWNSAMACADFDHLPYGKFNYRVSIPDLDILKANWNLAGGPAGTCLPGNEEPD